MKAALISAGGLELGDLLLGPPSAGGGAGLRPAADLRVDGGLVARLEMYGRDAVRLQKATVAMEVAEGESQPALVQVPAQTADAPEGGRRVAQAGLPLGVLPPGDYLVRAVVSLDGKRGGGPHAPLPFRAVRLGREGPAGLSIEGLAPSVGRFEKGDVLAPEVTGHFLDRMARLVPGAPSPEVQAATERARKGDAAGILDALPAVGPEEVRFLFLRGIGLLARGDTAAASTQFRTVLRLSSDFFPAAFYLGACYAAEGQDRQAAGAWQTSLVTETGHPVVYRLLADALLRVGEPAQAQRWSRRRWAAGRTTRACAAGRAWPTRWRAAAGRRWACSPATWSAIPTIRERSSSPSACCSTFPGRRGVVTTGGAAADASLRAVLRGREGPEPGDRGPLAPLPGAPEDP